MGFKRYEAKILQTVTCLRFSLASGLKTIETIGTIFNLNFLFDFSKSQIADIITIDEGMPSEVALVYFFFVCGGGENYYCLMQRHKKIHNNGNQAVRFVSTNLRPYLK